ncbi:MAG: hypothetical protein CM1200mP29_09480 [Verrucomicrobiota bacterium]|nr:MAG: hypothetical protein CM1200mP29_09480 [Verrucomicrobiota bacterium]
MEVERLQNHVAELGVADADSRSSIRARTLFLATMALTLKCLPTSRGNVEERERRGPVGVINEQCRVGLAVKFQKTG